MARRTWTAIVAVAFATTGCGLFGGDPVEPPVEGGEAVAEGSSGPAAPLVSSLPETEPNDTFETANAINVGRPISGDATGSVDIFALSAGAGNVSVRLEGAGISHVELFRPQDATGYRVDATTQGEFAGVLIPALARSASTMISVYGAGEYTLKVEASDEAAPCGFAREPDDAANPSAVFASVPGTAVGCISAPNDVDVFRVPAEAWGDVPGFGVAISGVEGVALEVRALDAQGNVLASLSGAAGEALAIPNLGAPALGDLRLEVRSQEGANELVPYRLALRRLPGLSGQIELEPNDTAANPTLIPEIGVINGYIHRSGDEDHYLLSTEESAMVRMLVESPEGVDLSVRVNSGSTGRLVVDAGGPGEQEMLCSLRVDAERGFAFSVGASSFQTTGAEPYLIHFELLEGTNWEVEPNDTLEPRAPIDPYEAVDAGIGEGADVGIWLGDTVAPYAMGYAFPPGDVDQFWFEVFGDSGANVTYRSVTVRLEPNAPADYTLELMDADGAAVAFANNGGIGESETAALDLPAGVYSARVVLQEGAPCTRPYRLSIRQTDYPVGAPANPGQAATGVIVMEGSGEGASGVVIPIAVPTQQPAAEPERPAVNRPGRPRPTPPIAPDVQGPADGALRGRDIETWQPPSGGAPSPPTFGGGTGR